MGKVNLKFKSSIPPKKLEEAVEHMELLLDMMMTGWAGDPSTANTATRFIKYLAEFNQPIDLEEIFGSSFVAEDDHHAMVIQTNIPFRMICEHHLLPATGKASLAYIPQGKIIGLSKMTRLIQACGTEKPSLQEHIVDRVVSLMDTHLAPKGIMVVVKAQHGCMSCRGVNAPGVDTISSAVKGVFRDVPHARAEVLSLINGN